MNNSLDLNALVAAAQQESFKTSSLPRNEEAKMNPSESMTCFSCKQSLEESNYLIVFEGAHYHASCFVCSVCQVRLNKTSAHSDSNHNIFCVKHEPRPEQNLMKKLVDAKTLSDRSMVPTLGAEPATFQVAKYNIHPTPVLHFPQVHSKALTIYAFLVDADKNLIKDGFSGGDMRTLKVGQQKLEFPGLKLNKMTPIKQQVRTPKGDQTHFDYLIMFQIGDTCLFSQPFTIVSSTKQLSKDTRTQVRPRSGLAIQRPISQPRVKRVKQENDSYNFSSERMSPSPEMNSPVDSLRKSSSTSVSPSFAINSSQKTPQPGPSANTLLDAFGPLIPTAETLVSKTSVSVIAAQQQLQSVLRDELEEALETGDPSRSAELAYQLAELTRKIKMNYNNLTPSSKAEEESPKVKAKPTTTFKQTANNKAASKKRKRTRRRRYEEEEEEESEEELSELQDDDDEEYRIVEQPSPQVPQTRGFPANLLNQEEDDEEDPEDEDDERRHQLQMQFSAVPSKPAFDRSTPQPFSSLVSSSLVQQNV